MKAPPAVHLGSSVKAVARRRPSFGKSRLRTLIRGLLELVWCIGLLGALSYLEGLPEPERSRTFEPLLDGGLQIAALGLLVASTPIAALFGTYRIVAAVADLCLPTRLIEGQVLDRGTVEGGPWTPPLMAPLVGLRRAPSMRWIVVAGASGRPRTFHVTDRQRWFTAAPGAVIRVRTTALLRHVRSVDVVVPAPPLVASAPYAPTSGPSAPPSPPTPAAPIGTPSPYPVLHHDAGPLGRRLVEPRPSLRPNP